MTSAVPDRDAAGSPVMRDASDSKARVWTGRILSAVAVLFMLFDGITKLMQVQPVIEGMTKLGYPLNLTVKIGALLLVCVVVYVIPRTAVLGAILLTGYLGGAVASNIRIATPLFSNVLFPVYVAVFIWGGLYLRDARLRALVPFQRNGA